MKIVLHPRYASLNRFVSELPDRFETEGVLLYRGRNVVKRFQVEGREVVAKRYKRPALFQRVAYTFFRPSKAERAYRYAALLRERGIDTPHEVAYLESRRGGLFAVGYFLSDCCTLPSLKQLLEEGKLSDSLLDTLAAFFAELHEKGILHGDLNLSNILYRLDEKGCCRFCLIDTNRSRFKQPTLDECLDNLKRVTHRRDLLDDLVRRYAVRRGLSAEKCVAIVKRKLDAFEKRNRWKRRWMERLGFSHK